MTNDEIKRLWVKIMSCNKASTDIVIFARSIIAAERERCAKVAMGCRDELLNRSWSDWPNALDVAEDIAEAIKND